MSLVLTSKIVKSKDGTTIFAEVCGDHSKPHIVFVHGLACAATAFDKLFSLPDFQKHFYLVRYDARGHGRSGQPTTEEAYISARYAEDFDAVCEAFKLDKPFYVGCRLLTPQPGSIAADICAAHNPVLIRGIIWLAALPYMGDILPIVATPLVLSFLPGLSTPQTASEALSERIKFCHTLVAPRILPEVPFAEMASWVGAATHLRPECAKLLLGRTHDAARLKEEGAKGLPLCIIHGADDLQISGKDVIEQMEPQFKNCESHLLPGLGHIPFWEDPETVASIIQKFVTHVVQNELIGTAILVSAGNFTTSFKGFTTNVVSKDGTIIHAQAVGNPANPHVIFAPGLGCTLTAFDPLFEEPSLLANLYMVRYDTRGHGLSGKPLSPDFYASDRYADDLEAIISRFKLKTPFFAGWSLGGAIGADIAANFPHPVPFAGLIWLAGLPYLGDILPIVATPVVLGLIPGLEDTANATSGLQTRIDFVESLSAKNDAVPYETKLTWLGSTAHLPPPIANLVLTRTQDPTYLLDAGASGWPLLILAGTEDKQINGSATIANMAPKFKNVESHLIPGGGHIIFYDDVSKVSKLLLSFISRVRRTKPYPAKDN
ncbi:hypothetical protein C0993_010332 [Termitomyces sp. T159_Od127]|nr:hypothetical protein C0993_010332 [Termitomyces sp. T159_Od127]